MQWAVKVYASSLKAINVNLKEAVKKDYVKVLQFYTCKIKYGLLLELYAVHTCLVQAGSKLKKQTTQKTF